MFYWKIYRHSYLWIYRHPENDVKLLFNHIMNNHLQPELVYNKVWNKVKYKCANNGKGIEKWGIYTINTTAHVPRHIN